MDTQSSGTDPVRHHDILLVEDSPTHSAHRPATDDSDLADDRRYPDEDDDVEHKSVSSMASSEQHELDNIGADVDEETGLTAEERRKHKRRKEQLNDLHVRIAGPGAVTQAEARRADKNVLRTLVLNAVLIALWYLFSLSISIVSPPRPAAGVP